MTPRQLTGFAICCALLLALAPVLNYRAPQWVFWVFGSLIAFGWGNVLPEQIRKDAETAPVIMTGEQSPLHSLTIHTPHPPSGEWGGNTHSPFLEACPSPDTATVAVFSYSLTLRPFRNAFRYRRSSLAARFDSERPRKSVSPYFMPSRKRMFSTG
jgi:hypothetical protein